MSMNTENKVMITIFIVIMLAISIFFVQAITERYSEQTLAEYCKSIETDSGLNYPCKCTPYTDTQHIDISIQDKIDNMCICQCYIGDNRTITIPIARAKE